nr:uncharacterized protein LOC113830500 [Penaeus vannamei]
MQVTPLVEYFLLREYSCHIPLGMFAAWYDLESRKIDLEMFKAENERMRLMQRPDREHHPHFRIEDAIKFVPKFNETEPEYFFIHFERVAALHGWPEDKWVLLVHSAFVGRAQEVSQLWIWYSHNQLLCKKWVESELDALEYDKLLELFVLEEVKKSMPVKVRSHIDERGLRTLAEVDLMSLHSSLSSIMVRGWSIVPGTGLPDTHRTVHTKSETGGDESKKVASRGFLSVDESCKSSSPVTILRDSAADISLVLKEMVPNPDCYTGEMIIINGLVGSKSIPICKVYLESKLITGYVNLGVVDNIPSDGISLLMGNDLVGDKVWPCPVVSPCPTEENNTVDLERTEVLVGLTKAQWSELAAHYCIPFRSSLRKDEIRTLVTEYLLEHKVLSEEDLEPLCPRDVTMARQYDLESRKIDLEMFKAENERMRLMQRPDREHHPHFRIEDAIKFVPKFNETEPEYFFIHFERVAALLGPEDKWVLLVHSAFVGRAQEVFSALDLVQSQCYYVVKQAVLNVYKRVPEAYRQDFRYYRKDSKQTFVEFIRQKQLLCKKWVESELDALEYDKLLELFVLEEVKKSMPVKVRSHIDERGLRTLAEVGKAADHFALTNPNYSCRSNEPSFQSIQHNGKRMEYSSRRTGLPDTHRTVHTKSETGGDESKKVASRGFLSVDESCKSSSPVTILRDSAADISLVLKEMVPNPDCYTGEMIIINGLVGSKSIPICKVYLESKLITGYVNLGVDNIPSDGISLLMGNDLVGDKVWPCPVVSPCPTEENNTVDLEREYPDLFPACAVTRSASRIISASDNSNIVNFKDMPVTREKLIEEQYKDPELQTFYDRLTDTSNIDNFSTCYYLQSGVLMRKYKPYNISADDTSKIVHQIVIPKPLRTDVLNIAHDISVIWESTNLTIRF